MKNFIEKTVIVKVVLSTREKKCRQLWRISSSKNPSFFCLKSGKIQIFFFVTPKFLVKMLLCTSWLLFGHPCSKLLAQSWRRIEKIQEIQKRYFFPSKVLDYSKLAVPCQRGEIPLGKICNFEKMDFKINNVGKIAVEWVFEKSSLQLRHSLQRKKSFRLPKLEDM